MSSNVLQQNLIKLVKESGKQIAGLERQAGLKKNNIYNILKGITKNPSTRVLKAIADVFEINVQELCSNQHDQLIDSENDDLSYLSQVFYNVLRQVRLHDYNFQYNEITAIVNEVFEYSKYNSLTTPDKNYIKWLLKQKTEANSKLLDEV